MALTVADLEFDPPRIDTVSVVGQVAAQYGVSGRATPLPGERDQNIRLERDGRPPLLIKVSGALESRAAIDLQIRLLQHLEREDAELHVPRVVPALSGADRVDVEGPDGTRHVARVLTFVEGAPFEERWGLADAVLFEIGRQQGRLAAAMSSFVHPAAARFMAWDVANGLLDDDDLWAVAQPDVVEAAGVVRERLGTETLPALARARAAVIHNDGHPGNVLHDPESGAVCGVIDFGDAVHGAVVADAAVCAAGFAGRGRGGLARSVRDVVAGYDAAHRLTDSEIEILHGVVLARLVLTSLLLDFQIEHSPSHRVEAAQVRSRCLHDLIVWAALDAHHFTDELHERLDDARS